MRISQEPKRITSVIVIIKSDLFIKETKLFKNQRERKIKKQQKKKKKKKFIIRLKRQDIIE